MAKETAASKKKEINMLRHIDMKAIGVNSKQLLKTLEPKESKLIAVVGGVARKIKTGENNGRIWVKYLGEFFGIPKIGDQVGKEFNSNAAFLPGSQLNEALESLVDGKNDVEFAYEIYLVEDEKSVTGYNYVGKSMLEAQTSDVLNNLKDRVLK